MRRTPKREPKPQVVPYDEDAADLMLFSSSALRGLLSNAGYKANSDERAKLACDVAEAAMEAFDGEEGVDEEWAEPFEDAFLAALEGLLVKADLSGDVEANVEAVVGRAVAQAKALVKVVQGAVKDDPDNCDHDPDDEDD